MEMLQYVPRHRCYLKRRDRIPKGCTTVFIFSSDPCRRSAHTCCSRCCDHPLFPPCPPSPPPSLVYFCIYAFLCVSQWERVAAVSYIFSLFALQQKVMSVVYLTKVDEVGRRRMGSGPIAQGIEWRRSEERRQDRPTCCEVFFVSLVVVTVALTLAWGIALFIILFA